MYRIKTIFRSNLFLFIQLATIIVWFAITVPALFQNHVFANLEPYPDGIFYVGQALNWVQGQGFVLTHHNLNLVSSVPPVYSVLLIPFVAIWNDPRAFYAANCVFGGLSIFLFWLLLTQITRNQWVIGLGMLLYLSHAYFWWLPSLPMAENIALPLVLFCLLLLLKKTIGLKEVIAIGSAVLLLLLTKYAYVSFALAIGIATLYRLFQTKQIKLIAVLLGMGTVVSVGILGWFSAHGQHPFQRLLPSTFNQPGDSGITFYSLSNVQPNLRFYLGTLLGQSTHFLWSTTPLTSVFSFLAAFFSGIVILTKSTAEKNQWYLMFFLLVSLFPIFLVFYVADARYILFALPIFLLMIVIGVQEAFKTHSCLVFGLGVLLIFAVLWSQKPLFRQVLGSNLLGRSTAWQYEAVQTMNGYFSSHPSGLVASVLLPFFVELYQTSEYRIVPISSTQIFVEKRAEIWGADLQYQQLPQTYAQFIEQGTPVFVTNAYLGHDPAIKASFDQLMSVFQPELVSEGCLGTCNLYQLHLRKQ